MRRLRKNTIFRVYLLAMCVLFVSGFVSALLGQRKFYLARLDAMDSRISDLVSAIQSATNSINSVSGGAVSQSPQGQNRSPDLFWIEGHGTNRKYAYIDICFNDGYRARYYFHPFPSRSELVQLHRQISHDSVIHSFPVDTEDDLTIILPHVRSSQSVCRSSRSWHGSCSCSLCRARSGFVSFGA